MKAPMSSRPHPPSGGTANMLGPVAASEGVGASLLLRLAAVDAGAFGTIDGRASRGL